MGKPRTKSANSSFGLEMERLNSGFKPDLLVRKMYLEKLLAAMILGLLIVFVLQFWIFSRSDLWTLDESRDIGLTLAVSLFVAAGFGFLLLVRWRNLRRELLWREQIDRQLYLLNAAVETMEIGISISDVDGKLRYVNRAEAQMHGYEISELIGREARVFAPKELRKTGSLDRLEEMGRSKRESLNIRRDGTVFPVQLISDIVRDFDGLPVGIVTSCEDISTRKERELELHQSRQRLRELASHLEQVRESERSRIAHEIHNDLGASLTVLKLDLALLETSGFGDVSFAIEKLHGMEENIDAMIDRIRMLSRQLRPFLLDDVGLGAALEWYANDFSERTGITIDLALPEEEPELDPNQREILYRVFQEGITNVLRHASAKNIGVELRPAEDEISLSITDDGVGYEGDPMRDSKAFGLLALKERVETAGGYFSFQGNLNRGVSLRVSMPLRGGAHDDIGIDR